MLRSIMVVTTGAALPPGIHRLAPRGPYRVRVYGVADPPTGEQLMLTVRVPRGPNAGKETDKVRTRLLRQVDERCTCGRAGVNRLLDHHLEVVELEQ